MPALQPLPSLAKIEANRRNAARSTGPKTAEGKARSRQNALKHGLAGAGIALPAEDAAAVAERFTSLHDQFQPQTPLGSHYVGRIALATVRLDRAARHEAAALALRVSHAVEEFDAHRVAEADAALDQLRRGVARSARRSLLRTPEGIAALQDELLGLRRCLTLAEPLWSHDHGTRLDACLGIEPDPILPSPVEALTTVALGGSGDLLTRPEQLASTEAGRTPTAWALGQLVGLIDREVAALRADDAAFDRAALARDRLGAADRALFDPGPAAQLARRYEAAAAREVDRALRSLLVIEAESPSIPDAEVAPPPTGSPTAESDPIAPVAPGSTPHEPIQEPATVVPNPHPGNDLGSAVASLGANPLSASVGAGVASDRETEPGVNEPEIAPGAREVATPGFPRPDPVGSIAA